MTPERWQQVNQLFQSAVELAPSERQAFLDAACTGDTELRREVEAMIALDEQAGNFLETPVIEAASAQGLDPPDGSLAGQPVGPYRLVREIGRGGMGVVYQAERADGQVRKQVAIKLIKPGMDTDALLRRFRRERQILADLDHPHIARFLDAGTTEDGRSYFIMDYVGGLPIDVYCDTHRLSIDERLKLFRTICSAVQYAHEHHIIHRDLKPSNILVTAEGVPKLLDFGIAKVLDPELSSQTTGTTAALRPMTPQYASPEQMRGQTITPASDVYSLGVILYELLTGHRPYHIRSRTPQEIERIICEVEPEKPSTAIGRIEKVLDADGSTPTTLTPESVSQTREGRPDALRRRLAGDLDNMVLKALRKEPERRYASVEEFSEDIRRHLEGLPVLARQDTLVYRGAKFVRRNKAVAITAVLTTVILLALVGLARFLPAFRPSVPEKPITSLAVLPLENLSHNPEQEYFADGMTEALITNLAKIGALRVISRTSAMQYKGQRRPLPEIGRKLNVDAVIEGSVQRVGDRVQIAVQLIHAATDRHLWAKTYARDLRDVLALQSEVARAIAQEIKINLTPQEQAHLSRVQPVDREAYEAYLKGCYHWDKASDDGVKRAIESFQRAIEKDPHYALAYAGLAETYILLSDLSDVSPKESFPKAKEAALKALELDNSLAEAHKAFGTVLFRYEWNRAGAERELKRAMELNPNYALLYSRYALHSAFLGHMDEALAAQERARELDPLSLPINTNVGMMFYFARQYDRAIEALRKALELDPNHARAHIVLGHTYAQKGMYDDALAEFEKYAALESRSKRDVAGAGYVYARMGQRGEALKRIDELKELSKRRYIIPQSIALIYTGLGEKDQAFAWLEKGCEMRADGGAWLLKVSPLWDGLRSDPRFADLLQCFGLPP